MAIQVTNDNNFQPQFHQEDPIAIPRQERYLGLDNNSRVMGTW